MLPFSSWSDRNIQERWGTAESSHDLKWTNEIAGLSPLFTLCFNGWESALQWTQNRKFSALRACTSLIFMLILVVSRTTATKKLWPPTLEPPRRECAHRVDIMSCVFAAYYVLGEISSYHCSSKLNSNVSVYLLSLSVRSISWVVWVEASKNGVLKEHSILKSRSLVLHVNLGKSVVGKQFGIAVFRVLLFLLFIHFPPKRRYWYGGEKQTNLPPKCLHMFPALESQSP